MYFRAFDLALFMNQNFEHGVNKSVKLTFSPNLGILTFLLIAQRFNSEKNMNILHHYKK